MKLINTLIAIIFIISSAIADNAYSKKFNPDSLRYKITYATRCIEPPFVDGRLDDESWGKAIPVNEFFQIEPIEFGAPSEKRNSLISPRLGKSVLFVPSKKE